MFSKHLLFLMFICLWSCREAQQQPANQTNDSAYFITNDSGIQDGGVTMVPVQTAKGTFQVWTKRVGNNPKIKVLLLHGGPGCTHEYFECFDSFLPKDGIEYIYYDQLSCGNSDNPKDSSLHHLDIFVEEVEQVRKALNLDKDNFYLYGHSWGGILAMQYALKYQQNLKGLIISDMMSSCPDYDRYATDVLSKQMDPVVLDSIMTMEAKGDYTNPRYVDLLQKHYYEQHILRRPQPWPEPVERMFRKLNYDMYVQMQGPSEFGISGNLENWDVSSRLKEINVPTLVIGATYDTMDPKHMEWMSTQFPQGSYLLCPNGSHMCMYDDQEVYFNGLIRWLKTDTHAGH